MQFKRVSSKDLSSKSLRAEDHIGPFDNVVVGSDGTVESINGKAASINDLATLQELALEKQLEAVAARKRLKGSRKLHSEELGRLIEGLAEACHDRFASLDLFNEDCKTIADILHKLAISEMPWMEGFSAYHIGLHNGTIVYRHEHQKLKVQDAPALNEASAKDRWNIAKEKAMSDFLMGVTRAIKAESCAQQKEEEMNQHALDCDCVEA